LSCSTASAGIAAATKFLGRIDQQVKLRGYRIELGEIEAVLRQHPAVEEAVVVAREDTSSTSGPPDRRLVAYVTEAQTNKGEQEQAEPSAHQALIAELRDLLAARLPAYMIPAQIVVLPALPLLPSGKINRRALPQPEAEQREFVAPRTPTETALAEIWAELLSLERVSVLDDFFSLGGHSLLATRVIARIREQFHVELAARSFFEHPTVAGLAQQIEAAQWSDAGAAEIDDEEEWEI
jgi:acyl carrier protein